MTVIPQVAIDVRILTVQKELAGVGQYIQELVTASQRDTTESVRLVPLSFTAHHSSIIAVPRIGRLPWQSVALPLHLRQGRYQVFHGPAFSLPPFVNIPAVVTIHDLTYLRFEETVNDDTRKYLRRVVRYAVGRAECIIVPSTEVKADVLRYFPAVDDSRIRVIALGSDRLRQKAAVEPSAAPQPFLLHVGTIEPRKNLEFLLQAFSILVNRYQVPHHLVLVGGGGWKNQTFHARVQEMKARDRVHLVGYQDDRAVLWYYQHAALYVMPSHYEGFGLPVMEAIASGVPTVATPTGGVRDLPTDEGIRLLESKDPEQWAQAIFDLLTHPVRPTIPVNTWQQTWQEHASLYREVCRL
jgi:glycosyltransferase involved in cell wall biosynthesis